MILLLYPRLRRFIHLISNPNHQGYTYRNGVNLFGMFITKQVTAISCSCGKVFYSLIPNEANDK